MIKVDALQKYENALLENFSPAVLRELKRSNWSGLLREVDRLYATMYHEWDCLQKDVTDIEDAVRSLTWTVNPKVQDGAEPEPMAKEVAKCVEDALWRRSAAAPGSVGHSFSQLLGALCHARYRGFNVHQIVWENGGDLIFPARYIQLPPQFLVWETKAGHPDRLLLVPDGMSSDGVPFPPHQYLVALNTNGPDHPLYNATFYSLVNWFVAYKFGLGWFMEYAQKYGMPKQIIRYANERERQQIVADLTDESVLNTVLLKEGGGREFDMKYPTGGASSLPQAVLLQKAEEACHKVILGQTLTSDTSTNGGSLAQAKVHAGVQADVVMKVAEQVADVLNAQLIPAIVQANYGRVDGLPIPELRCKLPQAVANIERAQFLKTVMEVPGMEIKKSEAYEYLALSQPAEGDEVLKKEDPMAGGMPGMPGGMTPTPGGGGADRVPQPPAGGPEAKRPGIPAKTDEVTSARAAEGAKKADPAVAWLAPIKKKLAEARSSGASLSELKEQISAWRPDTHALAGAMEANIKAGFFRRADDSRAGVDEVQAENPYGCNQHGHGWVGTCPYDSSNGSGAGSKSALQMAGGAENVNPEPDDDTEEEKKKAAAEAAKAKAEADAKAAAAKKAEEEAAAKAKAEAEAKAKEEEERKRKEAEEAAKKAAEEAERKKKEAEEAEKKAKVAEKIATIKNAILEQCAEHKAELAKVLEEWQGKKLNKQQQTALDYIQTLHDTLEEKAIKAAHLQWTETYLSMHTDDAAFQYSSIMKKKSTAHEIAKSQKALAVRLEKLNADAMEKNDVHYTKTPEYKKELAKAKAAAGKMDGYEPTSSTIRAARKAQYEASQKLEEIRFKALGEDAYFAENNDPKKALPERFMNHMEMAQNKLNPSGQLRFANYIKTTEPMMAIKSATLESILSDKTGRFLSCFEVPGTFSEWNLGTYFECRLRAEANSFSIPSDEISLKRPVYAFLKNDIKDAIRTGRNWEYGNLIVTFKPAVRERCTFTGDDSLNGDGLWGAASLLTKPKGCCLKPMQVESINKGEPVESSIKKYAGYLEAQIHGTVTANDVKSVAVPFSERAIHEANRLKRQLEKFNKKVRIIEKDEYFLVEVVDK